MWQEYAVLGLMVAGFALLRFVYPKLVKKPTLAPSMWRHFGAPPPDVNRMMAVIARRYPHLSPGEITWVTKDWFEVGSYGGCWLAGALYAALPFPKMKCSWRVFPEETAAPEECMHAERIIRGVKNSEPYAGDIQFQEELASLRAEIKKECGRG